MALNSHCNRSFQKSHRNNKALFIGGFDQNPFHSRQWPDFEADPLPNFKERIRLRRQAGMDGRLDGSNLRIVNRDRNLSVPRKIQSARNGQERQPALRI